MHESNCSERRREDLWYIAYMSVNFPNAEISLEIYITSPILVFVCIVKIESSIYLLPVQFVISFRPAKANTFFRSDKYNYFPLFYIINHI